MNDATLLTRFARDGSADAFRELVARHTRLVYACALQRLRDAHAAQDVTQAVWIALALKAKDLRPDTPLPGWLYKATRFACGKYQRGEQRRKEREMRAFELHQTDTDAASARQWDQLAPHLQVALDALSSADREVVLMRFYGKTSHRQIGEFLNLSEDAAEKRVSRALDKLRRCFSRRGVTLTGTALGGLLMAHAAPAAPVALVGAAGTAALAGAGGTLASTTSTLMLAKGALKAMFIAKVQTVSLITAACLVVAGTGIVAAKQFSGSAPVQLDSRTGTSLVADQSHTPSVVPSSQPPTPVSAAAKELKAAVTREGPRYHGAAAGPVVWGDAVDGVQAGVVLAKSAFAIGEPVEFEIHVRNQGRRPVVLDHAGTLVSIGPLHKGWMIAVSSSSERKAWLAEWKPTGKVELEPAPVELPVGGATRLSVSLEEGSWEFKEMDSGRDRSVLRERPTLKALPEGRYTLAVSYSQGRPTDTGWWGSILAGSDSFTVGNPPPAPVAVPSSPLPASGESLEQQKARELKMKQEATGR